jgi:hypothetical protein
MPTKTRPAPKQLPVYDVWELTPQNETPDLEQFLIEEDLRVEDHCLLLIDPDEFHDRLEPRCPQLRKQLLRLPRGCWLDVAGVEPEYATW